MAGLTMTNQVGKEIWRSRRQVVTVLAGRWLLQSPKAVLMVSRLVLRIECTLKELESETYATAPHAAGYCIRIGKKDPGRENARAVIPTTLSYCGTVNDPRRSR